MKKMLPVLIALAVAVAISMGFFVRASCAQAPAPNGLFNTAYQIHNLDTQYSNECYSEYYNEYGDLELTSPSFSIAPGDSLYVYFPDNPDLYYGGYAITIRCTRKASAVANISDSDSGASHIGISQPASTWFAPAVYDNYYNYYSNIYVRNTTASEQTIYLDIYPNNSSTPIYSYAETIKPFGSRVYYQEYLSQLNANQYYSAKIVSTGNIVTVVNIYGRGSVDDQLYSYNAFSSNAITWYAPVIMKNYYGYNTAIVIQNKDTQNADVKVRYSNGFEYGPFTIQPNSAISLYTPNLSDQQLPPGNTVYSAKIWSTNGRNLIVMVNESNSYNRAGTYNGFSGGSLSVYAPIVEKRFFGFNSSVTCQNLGTGNATMTIDYPAPYGMTTSPSIPPGGNYMFYQLTDPALATAPNYFGSATITANQQIVCIVNQDQNEPPQSTTVMDQLYVYNGTRP